MKLTEILHTVSNEKEQGLINVDDWKMMDADHLKSMGFEFDGDYQMSLKSPEIKVYKKKFPQGEFFVVKAEDQQPQVFKEFEEVINFFDHYSQPEIDKERQ